MTYHNHNEEISAVRDAFQAASLRKAVKLCCPKCWSAERLIVVAECSCKIDERGRAWPAGEFDGSYNSASDCACECGWRGDVSDAEDAFSRCCTSCFASPDNITTNDAGDGRYCTECHGDDI